MASSLDNITNATPKRPREEEQTLTEEEEETKRQKPSLSSYNNILSSLLEEEEEEEDPNQDLTSLITTLQEELFSPSPTVGNDRDALPTEEVMRRLLEASDDELGIPNREEEEEEEEEEGLVVVGGSGNSNNSGGGFEEEQVFELCCGVDDGFWEFEDVGFSNGFLQPEMFI